MGNLAGPAFVAMRHMVEDVLHGPAVRHLALLQLFPVDVMNVRLLPPLALVGMQQKYQLLLNQLPFLRIGTGLAWLTTAYRAVVHKLTDSVDRS